MTVAGKRSSSSARDLRVLLCCGPLSSSLINTSPHQHARFTSSSRGSGSVWVHDPALVFYPGSHASARPPETVQSQSGHVSGGTFFVAVGSERDPSRTVRTAR